MSQLVVVTVVLSDCWTEDELPTGPHCLHWAGQLSTSQRPPELVPGPEPGSDVATSHSQQPARLSRNNQDH